MNAISQLFLEAIYMREKENEKLDATKQPNDRPLEHRKPDLVLRLEESRNIVIFERACAWEPKVGERETQKRRKYQELAADLATQWQGYRLVVMPVVVETLGLVVGLRKHLKKEKIFDKNDITKLIRNIQRESLCDQKT